MREKILPHLNGLLIRYPALEGCRDGIIKAYALMEACYLGGGKVLLCGNGGSAADSDHMVGELMKGFLLKRPLPSEEADRFIQACGPEGEYLAARLQGALPAISLAGHMALHTAYGNDVAMDMIFAQQVYGFGRKGDVLAAFSTSGSSANVVHALRTAKVLDLHTVGFTGQAGGAMKELCDAVICVPESETYRIQEYHLPVYHCLCAMLEARFFA